MTEVRFEEYSHRSPAYDAALILRQDELRTPLGLKYSAEDLAEEAGQRHFGAFAGDELVGTLIACEVSADRWKMRQMAVHPAWRGRGIAAALFRHAEDAIGAKEIILHARANVIGLYEKLGYHCEGEPFEEVTIPHRLMRKRLA